MNSRRRKTLVGFTTVALGARQVVALPTTLENRTRAVAGLGSDFDGSRLLWRRPQRGLISGAEGNRALATQWKSFSVEA